MISIGNLRLLKHASVVDKQVKLPIKQVIWQCLVTQIFSDDLMLLFSFALAPAWFMFPLFHIMPFFSLMSSLTILQILLTSQAAIVLAHNRRRIVLGLTLKNLANPMAVKQPLKLESPIKKRYKYRRG